MAFAGAGTVTDPAISPFQIRTTSINGTRNCDDARSPREGIGSYMRNNQGEEELYDSCYCATKRNESESDGEETMLGLANG